jgi:propanol-preferring alcohol dehydrogenase
MRAMVLQPGSQERQPLRLIEVPVPEPGPEEVLIRVLACGVCRTDLHIVEGELPEPKLPLIPGHQIVGSVEETGSRVSPLTVGQRVGVPWLAETCGVCRFCKSERENLCDRGVFTGYTKDGGFAEFAVAHQRFCFPLSQSLEGSSTAPLLCAGMIGYRALRMAGEARRIGIYGFGSAAHIFTQMAGAEKREIFAFTRPGDEEKQEFACRIGAAWAGGSDEPAPRELDAAVIFAPAGPLVLTALRAVSKGGVVVCAGIHMTDLPPIPYRDLWGERVIRSVANLTRRDGQEFLELAAAIPIRPEVITYPLEEANEALAHLKEGKLRGSVVLQIGDGSWAGNKPPDS